MKFEDVIMDYDEQLGGVQGVVEYGPYELSIVSHKYSYGGDKGLYEIAVIKDGEFTEMPGITTEGDAVKGFLTESGVNSIMIKMHMATGETPKQVS